MLRVALERGLKGEKLVREAWPRAEVSVLVDNCTLSVLTKTRLDELPLTDCILHHSRVTCGQLGVRFPRRDTQLLFSGSPPIVCRVFREILAATRGLQAPAGTRGAVERYRNLHGAPTKRQRRRLLRADDKAPEPERVDEGLTLEQQKIVAAVLAGESIFFTGGAGTGKSFLLNKLIRLLNPAVTAVTASTALAASQLGGVTLHKWAAAGCAGDVVGMAQMLKRQPSACSRWRRTKTLVIDEISMVDGEFFDKLEALSRAVRGSELPFGGLQLVLAGDFLQLPPVWRQGSPQRFCFESAAWRRAVKRTFELTEVFRQKGDDEFCALLNEVRFGELSEASAQALLARLSAEAPGADATRLMPLRSEVEAANARGLFALDGELESFEARDQGDVRELDKLSGARRVVELRVGAKVLLTRTIDPKRRLVNGAQGRVISFDGTGNARRPVVSFGPPANVEVAVSHEVFEAKCGAELVGARAQLPLELAWAVSVHKSQGMTLNAVEVSLENLFEHGQAYVALSRARSLDGLFLQGNEGCLRRGIHADERCLAFHRSLLTSGAAPQPCQSPAKKDSCTPRKQGAPGGA